jgi:leucyl-tRNA synthetase
MAKDQYEHAAIERKWQERWAEEGLYRANPKSGKPKKYVLDMFPYPSGEGLHVGHPKGYIATDIYSRYSRMNGFEVLHPMGWDAFGLPAENFALKHKVHPRVAVEKNIANFKAQLAHIGFDYDWSREINTTDPAYYHWTQWIFLKMLEHGLAFQSDEPINWCPSCKTGLANEDLDGNVCERCGTPVEKKRLPQWVLKITDYADRMLADLDILEWPEHIKEAQRNWIGRSEGAEIDFALADSDEKVTVFTTRPDTVFGATYLVLAPEHPLIATLSLDNANEVRTYVLEAASKTEIERSAEGKEKTGVELKGIKAINPANKEEIPVFVADYVLSGYGTGAIMAVPAHDERDFEFAQKFRLPVTSVIEPLFVKTVGEDAVRSDKPMVERNAITAIVKNPRTANYLVLKWKKVAWTTFITGGIEDGQTPEEAARAEILEETGYKNLKLVRNLGVTHTKFFHVPKDENRDGHFHTFYFELENDERSPVIAEEFAKHDPVWVTADEARAAFTSEAFLKSLDEVEHGRRTYTGDGLLGNSGAFTGRDNREATADIIAAVGGRKVVRYKLRDWVFSRQRYWGEPIPVIHCEKCGVVPVPYEDLPVTLPEVDSYEPTGTGESPLAAIDSWVNVPCPKCKGPGKRETNTMPQWAGSSWYYLRFMDPHDDDQLVSEKSERYWAPVDVYVGGDHAVRHLIYARFWHKFLYDIGVASTKEPFARLEFLGFILAEDGRKMSKRFGNVINPDDIVAEYGADAFRTYEMFMGPFDNTTAWSTASIAGTARFIERVWSAADLVRSEPVETLEVVLNQTVKKVAEDIEAFKFNTAVSQMMICMNALEKAGAVGKEQWSCFLRTLAPFAPHVTEELWARLGESDSIHTAAWPSYDPSALSDALAEVVVQVAGKRRGSVSLPPDAPQEAAEAAARALPSIATALAEKQVARVVYVPGRILNFVPAGD